MQDVQKRPVNLSVGPEILGAAREARINLSSLLERALIGELTRLKRERWRGESARAISAYNEHLASHGTCFEGRLDEWMPRFAVYRNENPGSSEAFPFLVDIQADVLEELGTRVVIPLGQAAQLTGFPMLYLIPMVAFQGKPYALVTPQLAGISRSELGPQAGSLADQERVISTAIEFLLRGF